MKIAKFYLFFILLCHSFFTHAQVIGSFQQIPESPFAAGKRPQDVAFSPFVNDNLFAAVVNSSDDTVSVYSVDTVTGVFIPVQPGSFSTGPHPIRIAFSPIVNGNLFAAVTNENPFNESSVSVFIVNTSTGDFTPVQPGSFSTGRGSEGIAFSPLVNDGINDHLFAAVANSQSDTISVFSVNLSTGDFTPVPGSPFIGDGNPVDVAFFPLINNGINDPLFAAVVNNKTVSVYSVDKTTGAFTASVPGSPFPTGNESNAIAISPLVNDKLFAAVTNEKPTRGSDGSISVYSVDPVTGVFTFVPGSPFAIILSSPQDIAFSPLVNGNLFAAVTAREQEEFDNILVYSVNTNTGLFTLLQEITPTEKGPKGIAYSPFVGGNLFAAVANRFSNNVSVYQVFLGGVFNPLPPRDLKGKGCKNIHFTRHGFSFLNILTWKAPSGDTPIVTYQIYRDKSLTQLIGEVPSDGNLKFKDRVRGSHKTYTYYVVSVDASGNISEPEKIKVSTFCEKGIRNKLCSKIKKILRPFARSSCL